MTSRWNMKIAIKGCVVGALAETGGNVVAASVLLDMPRASLYRFIKKHKIKLPRPSKELKAGNGNKP